MEEFKNFFRNLLEKKEDVKQNIKVSYNKFENRINPSFAKIVCKLFKTIALLLVIVGLPVIVITFGSLVQDGQVIPEVVVLSIVISWLVVTFLTLLTWFFFSKWNVKVEDAK